MKIFCNRIIRRSQTFAFTLLPMLAFSGLLQGDEAEIPPQIVNKIEEHVAENSWPSIYYDVVPRVINLHKFKSIVEVGVALGGHAETILVNTNVETYYGIDPYFYNYDVTDQFNTDVSNYSSPPGQHNFDYLYQWVKNTRLAAFGSRCNLIREFSEEAAQLFEDGSIDCIFIDGDHRYASVVGDLKAWYPKLRKGGIILGDDYWKDAVFRAVNEYFKHEKKKVFIITSASGYKIWAVYK